MRRFDEIVKHIQYLDKTSLPFYQSSFALVKMQEEKHFFDITTTWPSASQRAFH